MRARRLSLPLALVLVASLATPVAPASGQSPVPWPTLEIPVIDDLTPERISALSDELLTADLERFGVTTYDPELPAILAELRASALDDLGDILAEQPGPPAGPDEDGGDTSDDEYDDEGSTAAFASIAGAPIGTRSRTYDQGIGLTSVLSLATLELAKYLEDFKPKPAREVYKPEPYTKSQTQTVGGRDIATQQRVTVRHESDGSTVTLTHTLSVSYVIPGPDGGAPVTASESATAMVRMEACPNESGIVRGRIETGSETIFSAPDGPGYVSQFTGSDDLSAKVDDTANVAYSRHHAQVRRRATGNRPAFGSEPAASVDASLVAVHDHENGVGGQVSDSTWVPLDRGADEVDGRLAGGMIALTQAFSDMVLKAAPLVWRSGRCLKVTATPGGRTVQPGSGTSIDVEIEHLADGSEVNRKVQATLSGPGQVTPNDPVDAPGSLTYRAPTDEGEATITFKTTSDRGIAQVQATYITDPESCPGEARGPGEGIAMGSEAAVADVRVAQAEDDCPGTIVLQGTVTGIETTHIENLDWDSEVTMRASMQVTLTRTQDDWWMSGTATVDGEVTGNCHHQDSAGGDFGWDMSQGRVDPAEVDANGWFVTFRPYDVGEFWDQPLETFHVLVSANIEPQGGTCGHLDGLVRDEPMGFSMHSCQELEVSRVGDGQFHGECHESVDSSPWSSDWTWTVDLTEVPPDN